MCCSVGVGREHTCRSKVTLQLALKLSAFIYSHADRRETQIISETRQLLLPTVKSDTHELKVVIFCSHENKTLLWGLSVLSALIKHHYKPMSGSIFCLFLCYLVFLGFLSVMNKRWLWKNAESSDCCYQRRLTAPDRRKNTHVVQICALCLSLAIGPQGRKSQTIKSISFKDVTCLCVTPQVNAFHSAWENPRKQVRVMKIYDKHMSESDIRYIWCLYMYNLIMQYNVYTDQKYIYIGNTFTIYFIQIYYKRKYALIINVIYTLQHGTIASICQMQVKK